ncbi:MAG: hypothetical protein EOP49_03965 [Sphingobacteriales bacterium]|nr:MAG: hypothetical protein EOP49_03965 [Sphingobacteriales bacterium]
MCQKKQQSKGIIPEVIETADEVLQSADEVIASIDFEAITNEIGATLSAIRFEDIGREVTKAVAEIDWKQIDRDVDQGIQKAGKEIRNSNIKDKVRVSVDEARQEVRITGKDAQKTATNIKVGAKEAAAEVARETSRAASVLKEELASARSEVRTRSAERDIKRNSEQESTPANVESNYDIMLDEMDKEGLINSREDYSIMKSGNNLIINGKPQEPNVLKRYEKLLSEEQIIISNKAGKKEILKKK